MKEFTKESMSVTKPMMSLIEPDFITELAELLTFGANKYDRDNWKKCKHEDIHLYKDALLRHLYSYLNGQDRDPETNIHELVCVACNAMFLHYMENRNDRQQ